VVALSKGTAAASHRHYAALVKHFNSAGMDSTVMSITRKRLDRAANGLADLLVSIKRSIPGR
jgi:hypothetical protein